MRAYKTNIMSKPKLLVSHNEIPQEIIDILTEK